MTEAADNPVANGSDNAETARGSMRLPPHIAAALSAAGGEADTAGQPWQGRELKEQYHQFDDDDGTEDQAFAGAIAALTAGIGDEAAVVASLAQARVFVPIVATATMTAEIKRTQTEAAESAPGHGHVHGDHVHGDHVHGDKESEMALMVISAPDGRNALPVFSSVTALAAWHPQARPVAVYAPRAALSAVSEDAQLMVVDPGADSTFVVRRPAMWALAQQRSWLPSYLDPELHREMRMVLNGRESARSSDRLDRLVGNGPTLLGLDILPGSGIRSAASDGTVRTGGGAGPELRLVLLLRAGLSAEALKQFVASVQTALASNEMFAQRVDSLEVSVHSASNDQAGQHGPHNRI